MNLLEVIKANIFGEVEAQHISDTQLANFLAVDILEREHDEASEMEINFLEKQLSTSLRCLTKTSVCSEII